MYGMSLTWHGLRVLTLPSILQAEQQQTPFTMQDGYKSNAYLTISVRDNARITCEALKQMSPTDLTKLWKVCTDPADSLLFRRLAYLCMDLQLVCVCPHIYSNIVLTAAVLTVISTLR